MEPSSLKTTPPQPSKGALPPHVGAAPWEGGCHRKDAGTAPLPWMTPMGSFSSSVMGLGGGGHAFVSSSLHIDPDPRLGRLLDVVVDRDVDTLAAYIDQAVPEFFARTLAAAPITLKTAEKEGREGGKEGRSPAHCGPPLSVGQLRSVLQDRLIDTHRGFLRELQPLHDSFRDAAEQVRALDELCSELEATAGAREHEVEDLVVNIAGLEAALRLANQREDALREFRERLNFTAEEQHTLEEDPVGVCFIKALERTRRVHQKSLSFSHLPEHQLSANSVAESTYRAIMKACEKITRYLLFSAASDLWTDEDGKVNRTAISADVPEVSRFYMRCVQILREESPSHWEQVMREIAQQRRASVLRRYFHLLTTGSATTSAGTYYRNSGESDNSNSKFVEEISSSSSLLPHHGSLRPLEADLDNPVVFSISLFAWIHQSIAEEDDFLNPFFAGSTNVEPNRRPKLDDGKSAGDILSPSSFQLDKHSEAAYAEALSSTVSKSDLLELIFDGITKQLRSSFDGILERLERRCFANAASNPRAEAQKELQSFSKREETEATTGRGGPSPRGLTGGLTKLFQAVTGRPQGRSTRTPPTTNASSLPSLSPAEGDPTRALFAALQTCFQLLQLFAYYRTTTFEALLGRQASLTCFIAESAVDDLRRVLNRLLKAITEHLFDSTARGVEHSWILRRLASINAAVRGPSASALTHLNTSTHQRNEKRVFVLDFLIKFTLEDKMEDGEEMGSSTLLSNSSKSGIISTVFLQSSGTSNTSRRMKDLQQSTLAYELERLLEKQLLCVPSEIKKYLQLLEMFIEDTTRQRQLLEAFSEQRAAGRAQQEESSLKSTHPNRVEEGELEKVENSCSGSQDRNELHFTMLLHPLLAFHHLLNRQSSIQHNLDDVCQGILEWNCFNALYAVLRNHEALITSIPNTFDSTSSAPSDFQKEKLDQKSFMTLSLTDISRGREAASELTAEETPSVPLLAIITKKLHYLHKMLKELFSTAAIKYYFTQHNTTCTSLLESLIYFENSQEKITAAAIKLKSMADIHAVMAILHNLYNLVASNGGLPKLPMLSALGEPSQQEKLQHHVVERVLEVYGYLYRILSYRLREDSNIDSSTHSGLKFNEEEASMFSDIDPVKLQMLMDA
ncbi:unnamed protein product [Phytomonas sp. Hart1]|nr:unnamed protein product [Phytomonas sp. Hart1]|eukprot:CCW67627.1 unnamed protein product [Phytomonas sp. isolate Hart1]